MGNVSRINRQMLYDAAALNKEITVKNSPRDLELILYTLTNGCGLGK